jgi:hypothetical protein
MDHNRCEVVMYIDGHQRLWPLVLNAPMGPCQIVRAEIGVGE